MANKKNVNMTITVEEDGEIKKVDLKKTTNSKISDDMLVKVKSTFFGQLFFKNKKSGEVTEWEYPGDVQTMTMRDLRSMKAEQASFFKNGWLLVLGFADGEDCGANCADIYKNLMITQYYENYIEPTDMRAVCSWNINEIPEKIAMLSPEARENLLVAINTYIKNGSLDSIKKIKAFEKALGHELLSIDE